MIKKIYKKLPNGIKNKIIYMSSYMPLRFIYGKQFREWCDFIKKSEKWHKDEISEFQIRKLKDTLSTAYKYTSYYHRLFDECGFNPEGFRYFDQLNCVPYLTKKLIQDNIDSMVNTELDKSKMLYYTTAGSTGIPMGMNKNESDKVKEAAFVDYIWKTTGYHHNARIAVLRGGYTGDRGIIARDGNRLLVSTYDMSESNMMEVYEGIKNFKPQFLHVYPSAVNMLSEYILESELAPINTIRCIYTASENLYGYQRDNIEKAFDCKVVDFYGHTEHACMAKQINDESGFVKGYSVLWQYGYAETIPDKDSDLAEIIATSFDNTAMPLIRYRTMDYVKNPKGIDGRISFESIEGRAQDFIFTSSGRKISIAAINMHNKVFDHVSQFQFFQERYDECILKVVRKPEYCENDEAGIMHIIGGKLGEGISLDIEYVESIPLTKSGKFQFMDQRLKF